MKNNIFSIRFDNETSNLLKEISKKYKMTRSFYIRKLLISSLKSESTNYLLITQEMKTKKEDCSKDEEE